MSLRFNHAALSSTLVGAELPPIAQFRGIPYGRIPKRFASPEPVPSLPAELDCTSFGPRCPQVPIDVGHLLRIPPEHKLPVEPEDEFNCLNLDVTVPKSHLSAAPRKLPVLAWIHGGSQAVTFGSAASGVCDMTRIVEDSLALGQPIVAVGIQYRLNIFAFGDDDCPANLALQDQALALRWIQSYIADFGGDPEAVTLAGESAGAVYCHAHVVAKSPLSQCILSSGSLYLSPPPPQERAHALRRTLGNHLQTLGEVDLHTAPVDLVVKALKSSGIQSWFLQADSTLEGWQAETGEAKRVMISDVQQESVIWRRGIWSADAGDIVRAFDLAGDRGDRLKELYHVYLDRPSSCKIGALDFMNDYKALLPAEKVARLFREAGTPAYRCLIDEPNPWQPSNGSHHAVDLVLLFGGFDSSTTPASRKTGEQLRRAWIQFIHSQEPWCPTSYAAFGPYGMLQELNGGEVESRRRMRHVEYMQGMDPRVLDKVFFALAAGRISLLN